MLLFVCSLFSSLHDINSEIAYAMTSESTVLNVLIVYIQQSDLRGISGIHTDYSHILLFCSYKHAFILWMFINGFITLFRAIFFNTVGVTELAVRTKTEKGSIKIVHKSYSHCSAGLLK
jgi:hypothetical protein